MESSGANFDQDHQSAIDILFAGRKTVLTCERVCKYFAQCDPIK